MDMTPSHDDLRDQCDQLFERCNNDPYFVFTDDDQKMIHTVIEGLDQGQIRVAEQCKNPPPSDHSPSSEICLKDDQSWVVKSWVKKAITLYFKISPMESYGIGPFSYADKIPLKSNYEELNVRVVPPATARYGSFMEPGVVLMPSYVNIGAYVGAQTMVDTWATVGSCAQIGRGVHLSGGVGIGGVLEPPGASPVIIEDGAFIGSRSIIVEGVRVKAKAVIAANVTLTSSSYIYDTTSSPPLVYRGLVPEGAVVVPGVREKDVSGGKIYLNCAYIIGQRKSSTDEKTSLNQTLREFALSV